MTVDLLRASCKLRAVERAEVLAEAAEDDVDHAEQHDHAVTEEAELQLRAADDKEKGKQR